MKMSRWSKAATSLVVRLAQHAVAEHVARHVADTDATVNGVLAMSTSISRKWRFTASQAPRAVIPIFLWS